MRMSVTAPKQKQDDQLTHTHTYTHSSVGQHFSEQIRICWNVIKTVRLKLKLWTTTQEKCVKLIT